MQSNLFGEKEPIAANPIALRDHQRFAQIAVNVPLQQSFTYINPPDQPLPAVGSWVIAPFGIGRGASKGQPALILAHTDEAPVNVQNLKSWHTLVPLPPMPQEWCALIRFASDYYHHPIGQVAALAFPLSLRQKGQIIKAPKPAPIDVYRLLVNLQTIRQHPQSTKKTWKYFVAMLEPQQEAPSIENDPRWSVAQKATIQSWVALGFLAPITLPKTPAAKQPLPLTPAQEKVFSAIAQTLGQYATHVVQGITGSGKSEVYFALADLVLAKSHQVLILMPEIALTPQMESRLMQRFAHLPASAIVLLHSGLALSVRHQALQAVMNGSAQIIIGTRSSVFAPFADLGLIVVDEEHDSSYKQNDQAFAYSARDLAIYRARSWNCPVVLGSATPSLESYQAAKSGRYRYHSINERATGAPLPSIEMINVRGKKLPEILASESLHALATTQERGEQTLVFLNRRGYAPSVYCESCGWIAGCPMCSANLVWHTADQRWRCHHCNYRETVRSACPQCGNPDLMWKGIGTQKIETILSTHFPQAQIVRIDRDATRTYKQFTAQQRAIAEGSVDIIIGTQMMAKGHDFPKLTTVIILGADSVLFASDFRGAERLFALLTQVAGRAGRHQSAGRVLVQSAWSDHPLYSALLRHDYSAFADAQLIDRQKQGVPPFAHQALLRVESVSLKQAHDWVSAQALQFRHYLPSSVTLYDAVPMRLARKAGWERLQMLIESKDRRALHQFLQSLTGLLYAQNPRHDLKWWIDVAPLEI